MVDELCEAVGERASVLLTGDPGVGKTCVLRALRKRLPDSGYRLTYCHNATLGLDPKASAAGVFYAVSTHVQELGAERDHPVFLIDEAHLLHPEMLAHLHFLLNYEWDSRALLSLILVGLPASRAACGLRQREGARFWLGPNRGRRP